MTDTTTMTGRERVLAALERRDHDRVPRHDTFWPETIRRWEDEGLEGGHQELMRQLGSDFCGLCFAWPAPFPGRDEVIEEDEETKVTINAFGTTERNWKHRAGTPEHLGFTCVDREVWFNDYKQRMLEHPCHINIDYACDQYEKGRAQGKFCHLAGVETFETTRRMMGDEVTMMALVEDPEWVADVSRTVTDVLIRDYQQALDRGIEPDCLWTFGDMAFNHATMCSPAMYRELIWPDHKRLADFAHDQGMKFIYHTDGDVNGVMGLYLDAGFDALHPLESKANMDIRKLAPEYGDRLTFYGNIDVMVMSTNDHEKIEHEIKTKFAAGKANHGYIYHSDHSVPPAVSWDTYRFIIDCVEKYGWYDH